MKISVCLSLAALVVNTACFGHTMLDDLHKTEAQTIKSLESTYKMKLLGTGGSAMYGIDKVALSFSLDRPISIEEARSIVVGSAAQYIKNINNDKALRPYLEEYPFRADRVDLSFFVTIDKKLQNPKFISAFSLYCGGNVKVPTIKYVFENEKEERVDVVKETYDEAKERINEKQ